MANSRSFSAVSAATAVNPKPVNPGRHRLRAVDRDEIVAPGSIVDVADLLPPGATWLPAPQHTLPALPGQPPMVGYLVLVPADEPPAGLAVATAAAAGPA